MGIKGEVEARCVHNIFSKIKTKNFANLMKGTPIQIQEVSRTPSRLHQNRTTPQHITVKIISTENKE
jgi:hypothetical protein